LKDVSIQNESSETGRIRQAIFEEQNQGRLVLFSGQKTTECKGSL